MAVHAAPGETVGPRGLLRVWMCGRLDGWTDGRMGGSRLILQDWGLRCCLDGWMRGEGWAERGAEDEILFVWPRGVGERLGWGRKASSILSCRERGKR